MNHYIDLVFLEFWNSIIYAFLGLVIGSLIVFFLKKVGYLKREYLILKIITKLYFVFIPILFLIYFWGAGAAWKTGNIAIKSIDEVMIELQEKMYPIFADYINTEIKKTIHLDEIPSNEAIVKQFLGDNLTNEESSLYRTTLHISLKKILDITVGDDIDKEKRVAALSNISSGKALEYGFDKIKSELHKQIRQYLAIFLIPLTLIFLGSLLVIAIEILISIRYLNKKMKESNLST